MSALHRLQTLLALERNSFSVTETARALESSQPGVSRRLLALEKELGVELLVRRGRHILGFSAIGREISAHATHLLQHLAEIEKLAADSRNEESGEMSLVTTQTQARYALPAAVALFCQRYPDVRLHVHQAPPEQMADMVRSGKVELAIATEDFEHFDDLIVLPCYRWRRCIIVPKGHELAAKPLKTLQQIAAHRLITYSFGMSGKQGVYEVFRRHHCRPQIAITTLDAEVIKSYVRAGLGVGLIAAMAVDAEADAELVSVDVSAFFPPQTTGIAVRRDSRLRSLVSFFIAAFAPHLQGEILERALTASSRREIQALFANTKMDLR